MKFAPNMAAHLVGNPAPTSRHHGAGRPYVREIVPERVGKRHKNSSANIRYIAAHIVSSCSSYRTGVGSCMCKKYGHNCARALPGEGQQFQMMFPLQCYCSKVKLSYVEERQTKHRTRLRFP